MKTASKEKSRTKKRRTKSITRRNLKNWLRLLPVIAPIVTTAFIYTWQHTRMTIVGLPIEELRAKKDELTRQNDSIRLHIERLQAPARIESIARKKLGMISPETWQVIALEQPVRPPRTVGETYRRADSDLVSGKKMVGRYGILKKRGSSRSSSQEHRPSEVPRQSG